MQILTFFLEGFLCDAAASHRIEEWKIDLFVGCVKVYEEVVYFIQYFPGSCILAIDLVYHHNDLQPRLQRLLEDEACLGKRSLRSIYQQQRAVGHCDRPLHFAPKIGMTGGIDHIYFDTLPRDGTVFCSNGNPSFLFQLQGVHHSFVYLHAGPEQTALFEHGVYECGFAVVHMGDNGNVSYPEISLNLFHLSFTYSKKQEGKAPLKGKKEPAICGHVVKVPLKRFWATKVLPLHGETSERASCI